MSRSHDHFVRSSVLTPPKTKEIIDKIRPHMPPGTVVIGGYLNSRQQVFKLNYHWELLIHNIDRCLKLNIGEVEKSRLSAIRAALMRHAPLTRGYLTSKSVDHPVDHSTSAQIMARWSSVKQSKKDFSWVVDHAHLLRVAPQMTKQLRLIRSPIELSPIFGDDLIGQAAAVAG